MLSFSKTFTTFPSHQLPCASQHLSARSLTLIRSSADDGNDLSSSQPVPPTITPPDAVEIRFKRGSRRRRKQEEEGGGDRTAQKKAAVVKNWDSMSLGEKALELYVGEKGMLFWLNKFAYASIFIVIGGWILFRFVGPSLNLYQLDTPPLAPTSMFKG